jgi:hypothetical protein
LSCCDSAFLFFLPYWGGPFLFPDSSEIDKNICWDFTEWMRTHPKGESDFGLIQDYRNDLIRREMGSAEADARHKVKVSDHLCRWLRVQHANDQGLHPRSGLYIARFAI